jgi:hypothetical protein
VGLAAFELCLGQKWSSMTPSDFLTQLGDALTNNGCITAYEIGQQTLVGSINYYGLSVVLPSDTPKDLRCSHELSSDVLTFAEGPFAGLKIDLHEPSRGFGVLPAVAGNVVLDHFPT